MKNIWADRFSAILKLSDHEIGRRIRVPGVVVAGLHDLPPASTVVPFRRALQAVYEPSPSGIDVIRRVLGRAHGYALVRYPTVESFMLGMYSKRLEVEPLPASCITGMAGLGKSALIAALWRLVPASSMLKLPDGTEVPLVAGAAFKIDRKSSPASVAAAVSDSIGADPADGASKSITPDILTKRCYNRGCCFVIPDEMQFLTSSDNANTLVTKVVLSLTYLGVPVTFVANYSLLHRLARRNHEERRRLLSDVICLDAEPPDSPALIGMLEQWCVVADGAFGFDPAAAAERFDAFSGGSREAMRDLAILSYRSKRERSPKAKSVVVTMADIEATYRSGDFSTQREDALLLLKQRITGKIADRKRKDLWCPIQPVVQAQTVSQAKADSDQQRMVDAEILKGSMTPKEIKDAAELARAFRAVDDTEPTPRPVKKRARGVTLEGLSARVKT